MSRLFKSKQSASSGRNRPGATASAASNPAPRIGKGVAYRDSSYENLLKVQGRLYMTEHVLGISDGSRSLCRRLLESNYAPPKKSLFSDVAFEKACRNLKDGNEAKIVQDLGRLLVPSAETLAALRDNRFKVFAESVDDGWNNSIPVTSPRPQPDYAVGFSRTAFSRDQLNKLEPALGNPLYSSYFMATFYLHFPFLTSEAKCGSAGLTVADRQNGHSMALAVRGLVELFKLAGRERELHREILTFSISHDNRAVRLYGYYPVISGSEFTIHRHPIHSFDIIANGGQERWTSYNFTVQAYMESLVLLEKIRSVIDGLPPQFNLRNLCQSQQASSEQPGSAASKRMRPY